MTNTNQESERDEHVLDEASRRDLASMNEEPLGSLSWCYRQLDINRADSANPRRVRWKG
jgi:hypothetical protein